MLHCFTQASNRLNPLVLSELKAWGGHLTPKRILIKPNWVIHQTDHAFPIQALVTDARVIAATVEACLQLYPDAESILVGDCPLQYADWPLLRRQSGLEPHIERLAKISGGKVEFRDLRREVFELDKDRFLKTSLVEHGDPRGYREVELGARSQLEPISEQSDRLAVNDYSSAVTSSNHRLGRHRYLISQSVLDADLFVNLPKWKSHQKSGLTAALKNLVGINGDKVYLPHFRKGAPKWGGDEYQDQDRWLYFAQTTLREKLQKKNPFLYKALKPGWELLKKIRRIETRVENPAEVDRKFYIAGGAWHGNNTIWRMIYDLNRVIQLADANGIFQSVPCRDYFCIVDGLISGEGNGPLQPLPKNTDWLVFGTDPFEIDTALAWFMGFDPAKIPLLSNHHCYDGSGWGQFKFDELALTLDGERISVFHSPINFHFAPSPGWRNYLERR